MHQIANYLFFQQMLERWKRCRGWGDICAENLLGGKTGTILHTAHQSAPSEIHESSFNWPQLWCELGVVD
jgi:hypothetical protein